MLGKLVKNDNLREIWKNEKNDFSKWLATEENLNLLGNEIGIDISLIEKESSIDTFKTDLLCEEKNTGKKIIIENQLEKINHDHLGKAITYASYVDAKYVIWVTKDASDTHKQAVEWLNQHTDGDISFFLIKIELWQIDNSNLAPKFNIIEGPNNWIKTLKIAKTELNKIQLEIWTKFVDYFFADEKMRDTFNQRKPQPQGWYSLGISGKSYEIHISLNSREKSISVEIYFMNDLKSYQTFQGRNGVMEELLGEKLKSTNGNKDGRIFCSHSIDVNNEKNCQEAFEWAKDKIIKFKKIIDDFKI